MKDDDDKGLISIFEVWGRRDFALWELSIYQKKYVLYTFRIVD